MPLVDDADVQVHLPFDKLKVEEIPDDLAQCKLDTERIIRGTLAGVVDSAVLATWTTPETTPEQIRAIGGRLTAALIYRTRYSEDSLDDPMFAQVKYNEAMGMLEKVATGAIEIEGVESTQFDNLYFEPNNNTADPFFVMGAQF